jgi:hypothetical protein
MKIRSTAAACLINTAVPLLGLVLFTSARALAAKGSVAYKPGGCDYFIVATPAGYDLLEWYGGHDPDKDDLLVGNYESYGMLHIYDDTADAELTVWVEDYGLSKEDALEQMVEHCE